MTTRHAIALAVLATSLALAGCRDGWKAKTYPAAGRVTVNGVAPEGARVHLHPLGEKVDQRNSRPWAVVQKDGTFTLSTYEKGDGAPPGNYKVTLRWPFEPDKPDLGDRLGFAFTEAEASQWQVTIKDGDNQLAPIEVTGAAVAKERPGKSARSAGGAPGAEKGKAGH
ncbi:Uncharacterized protein OS=Singulisphaera acidiphila (strain ATCC BAA-1392 / DSM 18658 / VKM B-2454 / MOB10) GN=Sinac_3146 PE=4 SV=1 [Gemmata massiliana]|uniref:Uncharacterized protein n=1 Tax=Gemmata massiliana TaxID=1210884 RepID=A0A6P2D6X5_9BACT|nr:hypothetical protein [Gemmata massiliana]VTR96215.1 Uncharacterized protein OS=Singulisphaera acidiphila (strain ATCC BAA-1392 / DSM 18658 / VKM B-2454 / MOB10) GN=Sinac_3146 PE=4 SV=1 [Gemmata massiliana]